MQKINDISSLTNSSIKQLNFFAFWKNSWKKNIYTKHSIPKRNWDIRILYEPTVKLKIVQKIILNKILYDYWDNKIGSDIKKSCTWFLKWKSILHNAKPHIKKDTIIKIDLKNYFPSISQSRVFWMFYKKFGFNYDISNYLAWLCTFENQLPQWSPTSPLISNIISSNLDNRIIKYIKAINKKEHIKISYTRYADDITLSLNSKKPYIIDYLCNKIFNIIEEEGFLVNYNKFTTISSKYCQKVTWIVVNSKTSLWRKNFRELKAIVHNINNDSWSNELEKWNKQKDTNINLEQFKSKIKWYIAYYKMVNNYIYWKHLILNK